MSEWIIDFLIAHYIGNRILREHLACYFIEKNERWDATFSLFTGHSQIFHFLLRAYTKIPLQIRSLFFVFEWNRIPTFLQLPPHFVEIIVRRYVNQIEELVVASVVLNVLCLLLEDSRNVRFAGLTIRTPGRCKVQGFRRENKKENREVQSIRKIF